MTEKNMTEKNMTEKNMTEKNMESKKGFRKYLDGKLFSEKSLSLEDIVTLLKPNYPMYINKSRVDEADPISACIVLIEKDDVKGTITATLEDFISDIKSVDDDCNIYFEKEYVEVNFFNMPSNGEATLKFYHVDTNLMKSIAEELNIPIA